MKTILLLLISLLLITQIAPAAAQTGGGFDLTWSTIDSGGGQSDGGSFELSGTIGQPDPGHLSGGGFILSGGFWQANRSTPTAITLTPQAESITNPTPLALLGILSVTLAIMSLRLTTRQHNISEDTSLETHHEA